MCYFISAVCYFSVIFLTSRNLSILTSAAPVNVTVAIYLLNRLPFLTSLPFMGPGFDLGIRDANLQFAETLHLKQFYITAPYITNCTDFIANYDLVARYYYKERSVKDDAMALFFTGRRFSHNKNLLLHV